MGFAADPLQDRFGALAASLVLGVVWAAWHLVPLFQAGHLPVWIAWWFVSTVAVRVLYFWIYNNGSSVLAAVLFHCMLNVSGFNFGPTHVLATVGLLVVLSSAAVTFLWGPRSLSQYRYARADTSSTA
jgi:membrane protease YdiL (CAAX protease family)